MSNLLFKQFYPGALEIPAGGDDPGYDQTITTYDRGALIGWLYTDGRNTVVVWGPIHPTDPRQIALFDGDWVPIYAQGAQHVTTVHHDGATHPAVPAIPADYHVGWNAGARSVDSISDAGQYQFSVPADVTGVITGFNDVDVALDPGYASINYALEFAAGMFRVIEGIVARTAFVPYVADDVFTVARDATWVRYYQNDTQIFVSPVRSVGSLFADASLYYGGDSVVDASLSAVVASTFTGDVVDSGLFAEHFNDDGSVFEAAAFAEHFSDNHDVVGTTGGVRDTHAVETAEFVDYFLLDESVLEGGVLTEELVSSIATASAVVERGAMSSAMAGDDALFEVGSWVEEFSDNHDVVGTTGGVHDTHAVETAVFVSALADNLGIRDFVPAGGGSGDSTDGVATAPAFVNTFISVINSQQQEAGGFTETLVEEFAYNVTEVGGFTETVTAHSLFNNTLTDVGVFADALLSYVPTDVVVTGALTDVQVRVLASVFSDTGAFTSSTAFAATLVNDTVEHVVGTDTPLLVVTDTVVESGAGTPAAATAVASAVVEAGTGSDVALNITTAANLVADVGNIVDVPEVGFTSDNTEAGAATETILPLRVALDLDVEGGALTDTSSLVNMATTQIVDNAAFTGTQTSSLVAANTCVEYAFFDDVIQGGGATGAWTAHLETFAMSRYTEFPFQSMAVVDGVLLGVNEGVGVFRLDAEDDAGEDVDASVIHDWDDAVLNDRGEMQTNEHTKHPRFMYMGALLAGDMAFTLGYVGRNGNEAFARYNYEGKTTSAFATGRAILGRGISSRYLRPGFANVNGARFAINDATLVVDITVRR